jgi:integrase
VPTYCVDALVRSAGRIHCSARLEAAGVEQRGPYALRHTFATEALAAGVSTFELARLMGTSVAMIDRTYGHLARDSHDAILARLDARGMAGGVDVVSHSESGDGR